MRCRSLIFQWIWMLRVLLSKKLLEHPLFLQLGHSYFFHFWKSFRSWICSMKSIFSILLGVSISHATVPWICIHCTGDKYSSFHCSMFAHGFVINRIWHVCLFGCLCFIGSFMQKFAILNPLDIMLAWYWPGAQYIFPANGVGRCSPWSWRYGGAHFDHSKSLLRSFIFESSSERIHFRAATALFPSTELSHRIVLGSGSVLRACKAKRPNITAGRMADNLTQKSAKRTWEHIRIDLHGLFSMGESLVRFTNENMGNQSWEKGTNFGLLAVHIVRSGPTVQSLGEGS